MIGTKDERDRLLGKCGRTGVLLFDDLAAGTAWDSQRVNIADLMDMRYAEVLPSIVTSNLDLDALAREFDPRLTSRLAGDAVQIEFPAKDLRLIGSLGSARRPAAEKEA